MAYNPQVRTQEGREGRKGSKDTEQRVRVEMGGGEGGWMIQTAGCWQLPVCESTVYDERTQNRG